MAGLAIGPSFPLMGLVALDDAIALLGRDVLGLINAHLGDVAIGVVGLEQKSRARAESEPYCRETEPCPAFEWP